MNGCLTQYTLRMPKMVYAGDHAIDNIPAIVSGIKKAVVFTDRSIRGAGLLDRPLELIGSAAENVVVFDDLPSEPTIDQAAEVIARFRKERADFIVAVGGGSIMDMSKLASVLDTDKYSVYDLLENSGMARKTAKTLMIPTTAGTGSEATPNSIVTIPEKQLKVGIVSNETIADYVILDAEMIRRLPQKIAASTGVDALAHAIECFTSRKATPFSDMVALEAFDIIVKNIEAACDPEKCDMKAKSAMLNASFYAGVAITAAGTTGVHALSYPLGGKYHIAHGVSNAILLMPVMKFNEPAIRPLLAKAYDRVCPGGGLTMAADKSAWILSRMDEIIKNLQIPTSLVSFGVPEGDLEDLVKAGMQVTRLLVNNMREITADDARAVYRQIL